MDNCIKKHCTCEETVILDIDLRTTVEVRVAKVAKEILPLNDKIGEYHISADLAYPENGMTKRMNLPVYTTETTDERILHVFFPAGVYVNVFNEKQEVRINCLEYRVDKKTEVVTEVTSQISTGNTERIQLFINIEDFTVEEGINTKIVLDSLTQQVKGIVDWEKPIDLIFVDRSGKLHFQNIIFQERELKADSKSITIKAEREEYGNLVSLFKEGIIELAIWNEVTDGGADIGAYFESRRKVNRDIIYLYENNDNFITAPDHDSYGWANSKNWNYFSEELNKGHFPVVYLWSPTSEKYCPATYKFTENELILEVSYLKEIDGLFQLWIERRYFIGGKPGIGTIYRNASDSDATGPEIIKIPLGQPL